MLPDAIEPLRYLNSPRTLEPLDLVLVTDVFGELNSGDSFLQGFHAERTTIRRVDVELKSSSIIVRSFSSLDSHRLQSAAGTRQCRETSPDGRGMP